MLEESSTDNTTTRSTNPTNRTKKILLINLQILEHTEDLPPIQRMSDPQKLEEMRRKMEQHTQDNNDPER